MRLFGPFQLPSTLVSIGTSPCQLFNGMSCHSYVNLEHKPLWAMKLLNIVASVIAFRKNVQNTRVGGVQVHAFEYAILYKEKSNDAMVQAKFMP